MAEVFHGRPTALAMKIVPWRGAGTVVGACSEVDIVGSSYRPGGADQSGSTTDNDCSS